MFLGTILGFSLASVIYFFKKLSKYKKLTHLIQTLTSTTPSNVIDVIKEFQGKPAGTILPIIAKGMIKAKSSSSDKNILSAIISTPIFRTDRLKEYAFQKIPYKQVMSNAFWSRPQKLTNISFNLQDLGSDSKILIQSCQGSDIAGILTQAKSFQTKGSVNAIFSCLKLFFNQTFFLNPLKFSHQIGEKISYYGIMDNTFGCVAGQAVKKANGEIVIQNPKFLTKQISFILRKLKSNQKSSRFSLILLIIFQFVILFYLFRWLYRRYGNKLKIFQQKQQVLDQNSPPPYHQLCVICYQSARSVIFKPCRHYGLCFNCYKSIKQQVCPICKQPIEGIIRVIKKL